MKILVRFVTAILLVVTMAACSSNSSGSADEKLQFYVSGDTIEGSALTKMSEKYTEETGVEIEVVDVPYSDIFTRINNMVQSDQPPALARVTGMQPTWRDSLMDLSEIAKENNVNDQYIIQLEDEAKALPLDLTAVGLFINKDLFDEAGVSYPTSEEDIWTWDEFVKALETVKEKTDARYGLVMDQSEHRLSTMLFQFGSKGFYEEDGAYTTNEETKEGLEYFVDLNDDSIMPKSVWTAGEDPASMFKSGQVAAYMSGVWQVTDFANNIKDFEWASVYMPYEEVRSTNLGGNYIVGFEGSGQEEETREFISWLYEKDNYEQLAKLGGYLPVVEDAEVEYELRNDSYEVYQNEIESSDPIASKLKSEQILLQLTSDRTATNVIKDNVVQMLNGEQTIDEAIEEIEKTYTETYAK
ncbi:ABC transporter substrate-binding protein [Pseudalkalibacillus hwajinpoensis]|uniref:ABC transporter substrate-binding protein n=1 Tax=Guptibacillus hwajinpoensis TaxID=208199 RepID=UPI001CD33B2D|nr:sugar ABC transporter substrate-binding protein [Pseudalkalibacillus hwajinpoensis]MCA0991347.1 sugar ABC transporter substrate-binding protein [Pseudalkalibacillus hwajinpoensis]